MDNSIKQNPEFSKVALKSGIVIVSKNQNKLINVKYGDNIQIENKYD